MFLQQFTQQYLENSSTIMKGLIKNCEIYFSIYRGYFAKFVRLLHWKMCSASLSLLNSYLKLALICIYYLTYITWILYLLLTFLFRTDVQVEAVGKRLLFKWSRMDLTLLGTCDLHVWCIDPPLLSKCLFSQNFL